MVEVRHAELDSMSHRHPIALRAEEIRREQRRHLEVGRPRERGPGPKAMGEPAPQLRQRIESAQGRPELRRVKVLDARRQQEARQMREQRITGRAGGQEVAAPEFAFPRRRGDVRI